MFEGASDHHRTGPICVIALVSIYFVISAYSSILLRVYVFFHKRVHREGSWPLDHMIQTTTPSKHSFSESSLNDSRWHTTQCDDPNFDQHPAIHSCRSVPIFFRLIYQIKGKMHKFVDGRPPQTLFARALCRCNLIGRRG